MPVLAVDIDILGRNLAAGLGGGFVGQFAVRFAKAKRQNAAAVIRPAGDGADRRANGRHRRGDAPVFAAGFAAGDLLIGRSGNIDIALSVDNRCLFRPDIAAANQHITVAFASGGIELHIAARRQGAADGVLPGIVHFTFR